MKAWTVMVYMAGDNNLDSAGVADLAEMKKVGSTRDINVVAQFDRRRGGVGTARYFIRKGGTLNADVIGDSLGETNDGDPKALESFITWAAKNYAARRYLCVLWNHGNGWDDTDVYAGERSRIALTRRGKVVKPAAKPVAKVSIANMNRALAHPLRRAFFLTSTRAALANASAGGPRTRGILYDDNAKDFLDNVEMKKVLSSVTKKLRRKIDVLGMDACLMSMAEVAYQIRDGARFLVGSEQTEPGDGWPYNTVLAALAAKPSMTPAELSRIVVKRYLASYGPRDGVTQAACDLSRNAALLAAIKELGRVLEQGLAADATVASVMRVRAQVQSYETVDNVDLTDLCTLLKSALGASSTIGRACAKTLAAIGSIVIEAGSKGADVKNSSGIAIYFPTVSVSPLYGKLDFAKKSGWGTFLAHYVAATRRRPR